MTLKDTIAKQKSDIDTLQKEIELKSVEVEDLRKNISDLLKSNEELKNSKKMTQKEKKREMRLIDEEWCSIMEAKLDLKGFNSQQTQTDPPKPLAAK